MSEYPPPAVTGDAAVNGQGPLTPEAIDTALGQLRQWLQELAAAAPAPAEEAAAEPPDLHTLLSQLVALRHEVNLQTKATRAQQEQNSETLRQLGQALEALQAEQAAGRQADEQAQEEQLRPLLKAVVDAYDALALAGREAQRVEGAALPSLEEITAGPSTTSPAPAGFWARWFGGPKETPGADERAAAARQAQEAVGRVRQLLGSLVTGYTMSLRRLERVLQQFDLEPIPCVGRPFDPELMEVVEVTPEPGRAAGEVLEEVRRGYRWRGRVFRYAQVRVAKPV